ncbi:MAG: nuclear transport factor 2 family protein [Novosphingobium sp.]|nr:nuclear transport factor 2 family protein [Novosphingobium sp.]
MAPRLSRLRNELADREAIRDCLYRYSRGVDRCDEEILRSVYWEDAIDDHCLFTGRREELIAWVMPLLRSMECSQHTIGNVLIRLHGNHAHVESYYHGYHRMNDGGRSFDSIQAGRYLDRFEKRNDEWRIAMRKVVVDWFREYDDAGDWRVGPLGNAQIKPGGRYPDDDSYTLLDLG